MTVASAQNKAGPFLDTGVLTFPFALQVFAGEDISVIRSTDVGGGTFQDEVLTGADYGVAINPDQEATPGGTVTLVVSTPGTLITIVRNVAATQGTSIPNQGGFYPEVLERAFDKLTMLAQQLQADAQRSLKLSYADSDTSVDAWVAKINGVINAAAAAAAGSAEAASNSADLSQAWAVKTDGPVAGGEFSSKKHAADAGDSADLSERWASDTSGPIESGLLSSKAYALVASELADAAETARGLAVIARNEAEGFRDDAELYATTQLISSSTTSLTPGAGNKALTIEPNKSFIQGMYLVATSASTPSDYMAGTVVSYDRATGALVLSVDDYKGNTARADWDVGITGRSGSGGLSTQVVTANTACVAGVAYIVATAGITLTLPAVWALGDRIGFIEVIGEPDTYTINFGTTPVRGVAQGSATILAARSGVDFAYQDATRGLV